MSLDDAYAQQRVLGLTHFLIGKSIIETLLIGALALNFYLTAFNPYFRGELDESDAKRIAGWAVDEAEPHLRVEVQLYIDGRFVANGTANESRPDVKDAGHALDEWHGFSFETPNLSRGQHEARVYAVHESGGGKLRTLQLVGKPAQFSVRADEGLNSNSSSRAETK